jgi:hypothetical protein
MAAAKAISTSVAALCASALLAACGSPDHPAAPATTPPPVGAGFRNADCNGVTDGDIVKAAMGISTWWYRGSDMDIERTLEQKAGRTLTELSIDGNKGFKAYDANACSIYVAKGTDVITWSIQTMNPAMLPDLCAVTGQLAELSQERVN